MLVGYKIPSARTYYFKQYERGMSQIGMCSNKSTLRNTINYMVNIFEKASFQTVNKLTKNVVL